MTIDIRYTKRVRAVLIAADVHGLTFAELNQKCRSRQHPTADLREILTAWRVRRWVENFDRITPSGQHQQIWRATQLLLDQWSTVEQAMGVLVLAPHLPLGQDAS